MAVAYQQCNGCSNCRVRRPCLFVCVCVQVVYDQCFAFPRMLVFFLLGTFQVCGGCCWVVVGGCGSRVWQLTLRAPCMLCRMGLECAATSAVLCCAGLD